MMKEVIAAVLAALLTSAAFWLVTSVGQLPAVYRVPSGAVVAFDLDECPTSSGWEEYRQAYGRFVRGIDRSMEDIDPAGERVPGSIQTDHLASHSHETIIMVRDDNIDGVDSTTRRSGDHHNQALRTGVTGGDENRPKNVALLYCEKD